MIVVVVLVLDQLTKTWAVRELADAPIAIVGDDVDFRLARNTGGAFSLFQGFTPILAVVAGVVAFFLIRTVRRTHDTLLVVALSLVLGGALGNLIDRVFRSPGFLARRGGRLRARRLVAHVQRCRRVDHDRGDPRGRVGAPGRTRRRRRAATMG